MRTRRFGRLGWQVSDVGYGMWGMGGWSGSNDDQSRESLDRAIALGCNFFDTAFAYGMGRSETLLGEALKRHPDRRLYVATKIPPKNWKWPGRADTPVHDVFPPDHIREFTEKSLKNLGADSIDLQQLHVWSDAWVNDPGWQRAIDDLKREKLIGGFGISVNRWEPANVLAALKTGLVDSVQVVYNIFDQSPQDELFPACLEHDAAVIARVPFDEGSLTGALTSHSTWPEGDWRNIYFTPENLSETLARVDRLKEVLRGLANPATDSPAKPGDPASATSPASPAAMDLPELALRFILSNPAVSTVIPGMRKTTHVDRNLAVSGAADLPAEVMEALAPHRWDRSHVVP